MVLIIDGEIVADDDPRAIARRQPKPQPQQARAGPHTVRQQGGVGGGGAAPPGPLDALATAMGIQGRSLTIPAIASIPARDVPLIHAVLVGGLTVFFGWRVLAAAALAHVFATQRVPPAATGTQRPSPR